MERKKREGEGEGERETREGGGEGERGGEIKDTSSLVGTRLVPQSHIHALSPSTVRRLFRRGRYSFGSRV